MKKTILFLFLLFIITNVKAAFIEVMPATLYYTANKNDTYTYHLTTYYNHGTNKYIFRIPFHRDDFEQLSITNNNPVYKDENKTINLTNENIKKIEEIIYWGQFYEKYGYNLRYYATQITIWKYLYPDYDIFLSTKGGVKLDYIDSQLNDLNNLLNGIIDKIEKPYYPINHNTIIRLDLTDFIISNKKNLNLSWEEGQISINPSDYNSSFTLMKIYDNNLKPSIFKNNANQYFIEESHNIGFYKTFNLNVINMDGNEKDLDNPETGKYKSIIILISFINILILIPTILIIIFKNKFKKTY